MELSETKRYNFISLYENHLPSEIGEVISLDKVKVPKIQRPYAQGRTLATETYIRKNFLNDIFNALTEDKELELNFIYGSITPDGKFNVLELLDGQQRLTTLFLLYWYLATRELEAGCQEDVRCRKCLANFYYETRTTSSDFCRHLADFHCDLTNNLPSVEIKSDIRWYFQIFNQDSTIVSMLEMLDDIHRKYSSLPDEMHCLYGRLQNITFYVLPLQKFRLTEELYIKMNARGLQLSPFDNFKAGLTGFISDKKRPEFNESREIESAGQKKILPFYLDFASKVDTKWIDMFWHVPEDTSNLFEAGKQATNTYEQAYLSFFNRFFAYKYFLTIQDLSLEEVQKDMTLKFFYETADDALLKNLNVSFEPFQNALNSDPGMVFEIERVLNVFYAYFEDIRPELCPAWGSKPYAVDSILAKYTKFQHNDFIILSAIFSFIISHKDFDIERFRNWMRVVHNIVENTNIDGLVPTGRLVQLFDGLAKNVAKYDSFFEGISSFLDAGETTRPIRALEEERTKAGLIFENSDWLDTFKTAEKDKFLKGAVGLLYSDGIDCTEFLRRYALVQEMFNENGITAAYGKDGEHILLRGLLTQIDDINKIDKLYLTERVEAQKHLKNLLTEKRFSSMHDFFRNDLMTKQNQDEIKERLNEVVSKDYPVEIECNPVKAECFRIGFNRLIHEPGIIDLAQTYETATKTFRIYYDYGDLFYACRYAQHEGRIMLDTERHLIVPKICEELGFSYCGDHTAQNLSKYGETFGFYLSAEKEIGDCQLYVQFENYQIVRVFARNFPKDKVEGITEVFPNGECYVDDCECANFYGDTLKYRMLEGYNQIREKIQEVIDYLS